MQQWFIKTKKIVIVKLWEIWNQYLELKSIAGIQSWYWAWIKLWLNIDWVETVKFYNGKWIIQFIKKNNGFRIKT